MAQLEEYETIDPLAQPEELDAALVEVEEKPAPERPVLADLPETQIDLPGGWVTDEGEVLRRAEVRELTGADEEVLLRPEFQKNSTKYISEMLRRAVVKIGEVEPTKDMIEAMLIGDRDALVLAVRRATFGDELDLDVVCPRCETDFGVTYSLANDVPMRRLDDGKRVFDVTLRDGRVAQVTLPTGADQAEAVEKFNKTNLAERNSQVLARCLKSIDGVPVRGDAVAKKLGMKDRRTLVDFVVNTQPGPQYQEVSQECPNCALSFPLVLDLDTMFRG